MIQQNIVPMDHWVNIAGAKTWDVRLSKFKENSFKKYIIKWIKPEFIICYKKYNLANTLLKGIGQKIGQSLWRCPDIQEIKFAIKSLVDKVFDWTFAKRT